jgi:hypothetical protein
MMPMIGGLTPAGIAKRTPYVRPGYCGWGIARSAINAQAAIERGMRMQGQRVWCLSDSQEKSSVEIVATT